MCANKRMNICYRYQIFTQKQIMTDIVGLFKIVVAKYIQEIVRQKAYLLHTERNPISCAD